MSQEPDREPTGLEFATVQELYEELHRRSSSILLVFELDDKVDNAWSHTHIFFKNRFAAMGMAVFAQHRLLNLGTLEEDLDDA